MNPFSHFGIEFNLPEAVFPDVSLLHGYATFGLPGARRFIKDHDTGFNIRSDSAIHLTSKEI
jgi:hypothetical protein